MQQIAFGYVIMPSGKMRGMYNYEMIDLAREACEQLGIAYPFAVETERDRGR